ncbi:MAG: NfeD family protein [Deltaproteobacteria bacterium]|nr:NfeD family protein [Deltaproteobacteria bacterium]MDQ3294972.1 NfeD family protein [Myxococcota bacterium]
MPADPQGGVKPVVNAYLQKVDNYDKVISLVGEVGRVSGRSGSLSGACLKVVPRLIQNLDALLLGGANTDGTIKPPSACEAAVKKLQPARAACDAIKADVDALKIKVNGLKTTAAVQADTDTMSAERQLWTQYYAMNPDEQWIAPACFGKETRPLVHVNKLNMVKMVGKVGICSESINTSGAINPLLPAAGPMNSAGKIKVNNQTYRANAPNGKRIPVGTECRIVDAKVGANNTGALDEHEWELVVDADVPLQSDITPPAASPAAPAAPGAGFSPNEKADPKKMATLIDSVTATSEKIGNTAESAATKTNAMMAALVSQSPAQGALGAFAQVGRVFDSAFESFEAKIKAHDKAKADAHAIAEKIVTYAVSNAIAYAAGPLGGIYKGKKLIEDRIAKVVGDLEAMATEYAVKLLVGPPPEPTPIVATPRIQHLADVEKLLQIAGEIGKLSARSSKISGATLKAIPKLINNLSALMHHGSTVDGTVKSPSECEALAHKVAALGKECDVIEKALVTMQSQVDDLVFTAINHAKVVDKPSAERQLWTKFCEDNPGMEREIDMESAFGKQPRDGLWANQMAMAKTIGKEGTVSQEINAAGSKSPIVPGSAWKVSMMSPGKVQIENQFYRASATDGRNLPAGTKVRVLDSRTGMTGQGTEVQESDWELIVQPVSPVS